MDQYQREQIERDNRAEVQRAKTGLSSRDWGIVLGALIIAVALLGFIYASDNAGVAPDVEPAAGTTLDRPAITDTTVNNDVTPEDAPELDPIPPTDRTLNNDNSVTDHEPSAAD